MKKWEILEMLAEFPLNTEVEFEIEDFRFEFVEYTDEMLISGQTSDTVTLKLSIH